MAKENNKNGKPNIFSRAISKVTDFFKGIFSEIKKVTWPTKKQVISNTLSVLACCLFVGAVIWLADLGLKSLLNYISGAN